MVNKNKKSEYKWVVMIYAVANDSRSEEGLTNFFKELNEIGKECDKKGKNAKVKILLQAYRDWDKTSKRAFYARRFEIKNNFLNTGRIPPDVVYTRLYTNMGDPNALSDFIVWSKERCSAEHYLLLLWGHGAGYGMFTGEFDEASKILKKPDSFIMTEVGKEYPLTINEIKPVKKIIEQQYKELQEIEVTYKKKKGHRSILKDRIQRKIINNGTIKLPTNKGVLPPTVIYYFDVQKNNRAKKLAELIPEKPKEDCLTIEEICKSLWDTGKYVKGFGNIEIVMIFGCAMQSFELAYELSKCRSLGCRYLIASEELVFWDGYNYKTSFLYLLNNPEISAGKLGESIITDTKEKLDSNIRIKDGGHEKESKDEWAISCVDIQQCGKLANLIDNISKKISRFSLYSNIYRGNRRKQVFDFNNILAFARAQCSHFGETAFVGSFIDITWFLKKLNNLLEQKPYSRIHKYQELNRLLIETINRFEFGFIVEKWIGKDRGDKVEKRFMISRKKKFRKQASISCGGHGVSIYFPLSNRINKEDNERKLFYEHHSDYDIELKTRKNGWYIMLKNYLLKNKHIGTNPFKKGYKHKNRWHDVQTRHGTLS